MTTDCTRARWLAPVRSVVAIVAGVVIVVVTLGIATPAVADLYQWTAKDGTVYYTTDPERIPPEYRESASVTRWAPREPSQAAPADSHTIAFSAGAPIMAEAYMNGVALTLVLDTGAVRTVISPAALVRSGSAVDTGRRARLIGVAGVAEAPEFVVPRLDIAGTNVGPIRVLAYDVPGLPADGLLGRDVLDQFTLTIDAARGRATLSR